MKEIKFRTWENRRKWVKDKGYIDEMVWKMNYSPEIEGDECFGGGCRSYANDIKDDEKTKWMQYTGLKDKNGKEIYEGDLVKWKAGKHYDVCGNDINKDYIVKVEYTKERAGYEPFVSNEGYDGVTMFRVEDCEIIGNIYKNSYLLK